MHDSFAGIETPRPCQDERSIVVSLDYQPVFMPATVFVKGIRPWCDMYLAILGLRCYFVAGCVLGEVRQGRRLIITLLDKARSVK